MKIQQIIDLIPEAPHSEALLAIEAIVKHPADNRAVVRCHFGNKFRLTVSGIADAIVIGAEGRRAILCTAADFLRKLEREIYEIDAAMADGSYQQTASPVSRGITAKRWWTSWVLSEPASGQSRMSSPPTEPNCLLALCAMRNRRLCASQRGSDPQP